MLHQMATSEQMKATFKKYLYKNEAIQMFIMWEVIMNNWRYSVFYDLPSALCDLIQLYLNWPATFMIWDHY